MLVLGAVALSDIQNPRIQIVSPQCILLRWEEIVCCRRVSQKLLTAEIAEQTQEFAEKTENQDTPGIPVYLDNFGLTEDSLCALCANLSVLCV
jgi:hypothetical protein